jgi:hypothetical protein
MVARPDRTGATVLNYSLDFSKLKNENRKQNKRDMSRVEELIASFPTISLGGSISKKTNLSRGNNIKTF